jgi:hypothetical protein
MSLAMVAALSRGGNKRDDGRDSRMEGRERAIPYEERGMRYPQRDPMPYDERPGMGYGAMPEAGGRYPGRRMGGDEMPAAHYWPHMPPYARPYPRYDGPDPDQEEPEMMADNVTPIEDYRRIGFGSEMRRQPRWENGRYKPRSASMHYGDDEPEQMKFGGVIGINHENGKGSKLTKAQAEEWVESMENDSEQKPKGGMFSWEVARDWAQKVGIQPTGQRMIDFYAAMNAMYSDYSAVAARYKIDAPEFYAHMAKAFIDDPDAVKNKTAMYYRCIVEK